MKTQISLGIRPVWSESSLSAWRRFRSSVTQKAHNKTLIYWVEAQADLSLGWVYGSFCWFYHAPAQILLAACLRTGVAICLQQFCHHWNKTILILKMMQKRIILKLTECCNQMGICVAPRQVSNHALKHSFPCLFCYLMSKSTTMVMSRWSVNLTPHFSWAGLNLNS